MIRVLEIRDDFSMQHGDGKDTGKNCECMSREDGDHHLDLDTNDRSNNKCIDVTCGIQIPRVCSDSEAIVGSEA